MSEPTFAVAKVSRSRLLAENKAVKGRCTTYI